MNHEGNQVQHLTTEQLLDYLERRPLAPESSVVVDHLETGCQACQADLVWLKDTLNLMTSDVWLDPPAHLSTSARRLFQEEKLRNSHPTFTDWLKSMWTQPRTLMVGATVILIVVIVSGVLLWSGPKDSSVAEIESVDGLVMVQAPGGDAWLPATNVASLPDGSKVRTGDDAEVVLTFPDASQVLIAPDTELTLVQMNAQINGSSRVIVIRQSSGTTHNIVQDSSSSTSRYEVQTPSATVIVHGTEFTVDVDDAGATRVMVDKGSVSVAAQGTTIIVDAGYATTVNVGEPPKVVVTAPTKPAPTEKTNSKEDESQERENLASVEPPATASPTPTSLVTFTPTPSSMPPSTPNPTSAPSQQPATSTPASGGPLPTSSEIPSPTPPPTETPKKNNPDPPGLTNTPEPPKIGHTRTPTSNNRVK